MKYFVFFIKVLVVGITAITLFPQASFALINGIPAVDLLGQYDQTSFTNPVPVYTKSGENDGPNKFGFSSP
ncbi:MAG: hypothetical protein M3Q34_01610 [bacterium]|nr:hypothetical protein [bacterium]